MGQSDHGYFGCTGPGHLATIWLITSKETLLPVLRFDNDRDVEKYHNTRNTTSCYFRHHSIQRYPLYNIGPELFGIKSSIGVDHDDWNHQTGKHYSIFFNVFVLLQVFNEINCRKLKSSELNVFSNFFNNPLFILIMISTLVIQYLCVQYGGQSLRTVPLETH